MGIEIVTLAERPDLHSAIWDMPSGWPPFMLEDPVARLMGRLHTLFPELQFAALDADEVVGYVHAASFAWDGDRASLPDRGWDAIMLQAFRDRDHGNEPTAVTLLEATVRPDRRGGGLSNALLVGVRDRCRELGYGALFGPVRPTHKSLEPTTPMAEYIARVRPDGLPEDPWLRVHTRLGAQIVRIAAASMTIGGSLAQWRGWTGLPFDRTGDVIVPGALVPVHASVEHDHAVYVEPNVWMMHEL
jgi:GNAT superfamily N-acetyltransferase